MTTVDAADATHGEGEDHGHNDHGHHEHGEFIAHHFTGPRQQYDSAKLGIWLFLVTEILFFSGLFVALFVGIVLTDTDQYQDTIREAESEDAGAAMFSPLLERLSAAEEDK